MLTNKSKLCKNIIFIIAMLLLLSGSIFSLTYAIFGDYHENQVTINVAKMQTEITTEEVSPQDLIARNEFTKTITYNVVSDFEIYFRVYAKVEMQTYDGTKTNIIERTDLIDLTNVSNSVKGVDNKWYYTTTTEPVAASNGEYSMTFTFKVSPIVSEDLITDSEFNLNKDLKTTITYYFEYVQVSGYEDWNNFIIN